MPRTLTAGTAAAIAAQSYGYDLLIEAPSIGLAVSWFFAPDGTWENRLLSVESIEYSIPSGGGVGAVSQLVFTLAEDGTGQSLLNLEAAHLIDGAQITLKLLFAGELYANAIPLFTGFISGWEVNDGEGIVTATDERLARNIQLPKTLVTRATHPNAPDESIGQALPIVYSAGGTGAPLPMLLVDTLLSEYQVSEHTNGRMLRLYGVWPLGTDHLKTIAANDTQGLIIGTNRLRLLQRLTETKFGQNTGAPTVQSTVGTVTNPLNLVDSDPTSLAVIQTIAPDGIGRISLDYVHPDPVGSNTIDVDLINHRKAVSAAVTVHGNFVLDTIRQDGSVAIPGIFASLERRIQSSPQTEHFRVSGISLEAGHILRMTTSAINETGAAGTVNDGYEVGQILVTASYLVTGPFEPLYLPDEVFTGGGGVFEPDVFPPGVFEEGTLTSFRGRVDTLGTITGTPGTVYSNPVDVIASVLLDELGLTTDPLTISTAQTGRSDWEMAGGLGAGWFRSRTGALDLLHSLCLQAAVYLFPRGDGTFIIKTVLPLESPTFSIGPAGSGNDYLLYETADPGSPPSNWKRTLRYRGGRNDLIRNSFEIHYAYHPARGQFRQVAQASSLGSNDPSSLLDLSALALLQQSHAQFGDRDPYQLEADFIYQEATAFKLLNLLIPYFMFPRQEVEFESTMAPLPVLLGETVAVDTTGMPARMRGQVFEIDRIRYAFEQGKIFLHGTQRTLLSLEYFRIRDQAGTIWFLWVSGMTEELVVSPSPPATSHTKAVEISVTPIPYWLALQDPTAVTRYLLPTSTGDITGQSTVPTVGTGYVGSPSWLATTGKRYIVTVDQFLGFTVQEEP